MLYKYTKITFPNIIMSHWISTKLIKLHNMIVSSI